MTAENVSIVDGSGATRISDASFTIRAGEIVGIAAVEGQGQHALLRAIAGRLPIASGATRGAATMSASFRRIGNGTG